MVIEWHFFHGFLGKKTDWAPVIEAMNLSVDEYEAHDLVEDFYQLDEDNQLEDWGRYKTKELGNKKAKYRVAVGYSLGGRLLCHMNYGVFDKVVLLGTHPGLQAGREERSDADLQWIKKSRELPREQWLSQWNAQEVFTNDKIRPEREMSEDRFRTWLDILQTWSLSKQEPRDLWLQSDGPSIFWGIGAEDKKFIDLKPRMETCLGKDKIFQIPQAGHGVLFDNPQGLAQILMEIGNVR